MMNSIKDDLAIYINKKNEEMQTWLHKKFLKFEEQTNDQLTVIEKLISSKSSEQGNYQMALKEEMEELNRIQRKQQTENLSMIK